jgi:probable HAF family extracellular repeat protein
MALIDRTIRLPIAAVVVLAALAGTVASVSAASPAGGITPGPVLPGASPGTHPSARSQIPVFVLDRSRFTAFDTPGEGAQDLVGINNRGQIVGGYKEDLSRGVAGCGQRGFLRDKHGRFARIDVPGVTGPIDINDHGQIVGQFQYTDYCPNNADPLRSFLRDRSGRFTAIHVPGSVYTTANGVNNRGQVVGEHLDAVGTIHGYLWDKGRFTTIDVPDAAGTSITDINDRGQVIGLYADASGMLHAFFRDEHDGITAIDTAGVRYTIPFGINNRGQIVGFAASDLPIVAGVTVYGFLLAEGVKGPFTRIDFPGAPGTFATDINDHGQIVGIYANPDAPPDRQRNPMEPRMMMMSGR